MTAPAVADLELLDERGVVDLLSGAISVFTLRAWRSQRRGPAFLKIGSRVCYRRSDVLGWLEGHVVRPEDERLSAKVRRAL
jgi:hypothetical protein